MKRVTDYTIPLNDSDEFEEWWKSLTEVEQREWLEVTSASPRWSLNQGTQTDAFYSKADILGFGGAAGGDQDLGSLVYTPFGVKEMGDIKIGDKVCNVFGGSSEVICTTDLGKRRLFNIRFSDGSSVRCGHNHLWCVWNDSFPPSEWFDRTLFVDDGSRVLPLHRIISDMSLGIKYRVLLCEKISGSSKCYRINSGEIGKWIVDVTELSAEDTRCITVDCPSGLYITDNKTITHNSKSALLILLCAYAHHRSVIFRYESVQMKGMVDDMEECIGTNVGLTRQGKRFYLPGVRGKMVEWGGLTDEKSANSWRGIAHDFIGFDEVTEINEKWVRFVQTWNRTTLPNQSTRIVMTFNPPTTPSGRWVISYFGPWLDERHDNPAKPGELRWYISDENGQDKEVSGPEPIEMRISGKKMPIYPKSRTFVPSLVTDNPFLSSDTSYISTLQSLEEPLRSQMLMGDFRSGIIDDEYQVIPTKWVDEAMERWRPMGDKETMTALGVDPARGGKDITSISRRHGYWWDVMVRVPGIKTPEGADVAALCMKNLRDGATVLMDAHSIGSSPYDILKSSGIPIVGILAQKKVEGRPCGSVWEFYNQRALMWWRARCVLNPDNKFYPALPKDNRLRSDLITPRWGLQNGKVLIQSKDELKSILGRSTDDGDAFCMSLMNMDKDGSNDGSWRKVRRNLQINSRAKSLSSNSGVSWMGL